MLQKLKIENFTTQSGYQLDLQLSYETFGQQLVEAPVILVNHALTGNSHVSGPDGWWNEIIGDDKCIDTRKYSILSFNIPGNGYDGFLIENYKEFVAQDVARAFLKGLELLEIESLFAIIGGSLGNLFDRMYYYAVPDFIDLHLGNYHWFIFNVADIFITLGIIGLIITELFKKEKISENV